MCNIEIHEPKYDGDKYRLVASGVDHYEADNLESFLVLFESESEHIISTLAKGINALMDLALVADS